MVHLPIRLFLSTIYLSSLASHLLASGLCCEGDNHCSGCWMCKGSDLRACWDVGIEMVNSCSNHVTLSDQAKCYCQAYSKISMCWSKGVCCTEYAPTLAAATNLCNLNTYPPHLLSAEILEKAKEDAYNVRQTIWTNNGGLNVPKLGVYVKAFEFSDQASYHYKSPSASAHEDDNRYTKAQSNDHTNYHLKSQPKSSDVESPDSTLTAELGTTKPSSQTDQHNVTRQRTLTTTPPQALTVHHKAKCTHHQQKCQSQIAKQYRKARRDSSGAKHVKFAKSPSSSTNSHTKKSQIGKRSKVQCGTDFHGVTYPSEVPPTVLKEYSEL